MGLRDSESCERCEQQAGKSHSCLAHGKEHDDGCVHTVDGQYLWLCTDCLLTIADEWMIVFLTGHKAGLLPDVHPVPIIGLEVSLKHWAYGEGINVRDFELTDANKVSLN